MLKRDLLEMKISTWFMIFIFLKLSNCNLLVDLKILFILLHLIREITNIKILFEIKIYFESIFGFRVKIPF